MLPLALLAAHLVGDFVFQTRWQADGKFGWSADALALRTAHVFFYGVAFVPIVLWRCWHGPPWWHGPAFFALLLVLHWLTDSRRFTSTVGDWVAWNLGGAGPPAEKRGIHAAMGAPLGEFDLPPNPWPSIGLAIDQSLHVVQIAVLAWLLLT